ncbi:L-2-hydroxyglutarate oxidase [Vibrio sp. LaRot3]|uniref:L-2-hydroxyglutarate oxidase n=1 Tax=Vibrio sp. LaRot3 TaxID=2998829 RepID=UPI0022CE0893|nr:L-2-hydroxyglutarate oxidase [Vibrio sp. LaRot3]MDA0148505.1 L-2-hydroxyglutarate oxidase [Vibrio sp. LaRot3]
MYDYIIVGGGIVGASTAWQLKQRLPEKRILLVEKEAQFAQHQTGHNSGVIHAGVYYPPGSLKADFCKRGAKATKAFCLEHNIPVERCGKLIVATDELEQERMSALYDRCVENGIEVDLLDHLQLKLAEPNIVGVGAIYVKQTAIVDYQQVTKAMVDEFKALGGETSLRTEVIAINELPEEVQLTCLSDGQTMQLNSQHLITCTGLMADRVSRMLGIETDFQIIPYRGEYFRLDARHNQIVNHLIYPVPDPNLPFLGVHLTRMIDGSVTVGPNAVQGWKREGYGRWNMSIKDTWQMLRFSGFWKVTRTHLQTGFKEWLNSWWKPGYLRRVNLYCPSIELADLQPYPAGIRAQAVTKDGQLVHDFLFSESERSLNVCNAPSPAATSAIPIGEYICDKIERKFSGKD